VTVLDNCRFSGGLVSSRIEALSEGNKLVGAAKDQWSSSSLGGSSWEDHDVTQNILSEPPQLDQQKW